MSSTTHLVAEGLPRRLGARTAWRCSLQHICQIAAGDWSDQCKAAGSLCRKTSCQTQDAKSCHVFIGYLLAFPEAVIRTLHWEREGNYCVVQNHHTSMKEEDRLICVFFRIAAARGWKTFLIEHQGTETCLIIYFKDALNGTFTLQTIQTLQTISVKTQSSMANFLLYVLFPGFTVNWWYISYNEKKKKASLTKGMLLFACWFVTNPNKLTVTEDENQTKEHFSQIRTSSITHD